ncbi:hypothetical protein D9M71_467090 [compost metagenome]
MDHGIGSGQVQAHATGFEADEKNLQTPALEVLYRCPAIAGFTCQKGVGDGALLQFCLDQPQHAGEL